MSGKTGIKVFAPAAIANFTVGMGVMSVAVNQPGDEIVAKIKTGQKGISISSITGYKQGLSKDPNLNSASYGAQLLLDHVNENIGIDFEIHKRVPLNSGFSSNASSAVAGVYAANQLLNRPLERYDLLDIALKAEKKFSIRPNYSQVCSILFGGIILFRPEAKEKFQKLYTPHGINLTLLFPEVIINEQSKLDLLLNKIDINDHVDHSGNLAAFVTSLFTSNFNLLSDSLQDTSLYDTLIRNTPFFNEIKEIANKTGALACGLAGLGPGIFIVNPNTLVASELTKQIEPLYSKEKLKYTLYQTEINLNGVYKY